jgi:hypothetical protein
MNKQSVLPVWLLVSILLLGCYSAVQKEAVQKTPMPELKSEGIDQKAAIVELKQLYEAARSEPERRAVCLRAIDEGVIRRNGPVSSIDAVFGTRFASKLPTREEGISMATVDFVAVEPGPDKSEAAARKGWFMAVAYDYNGDIQNYYLTNLHK